MLDLLSVVDQYRAEADWMGVFYDDVRQVGTILFAPGRTLKDAKKMLRELRDEWKDELNRYQRLGSITCLMLEGWGRRQDLRADYSRLRRSYSRPITTTRGNKQAIWATHLEVARPGRDSPAPQRSLCEWKAPPGRHSSRRRPEELRLAKILLQARMQSNGIAQKARRDFKGLVAALRADWDSVYNTPTAAETS